MRGWGRPQTRRDAVGPSLSVACVEHVRSAPRRMREGGFTLIEVLLAGITLAIAFTALLGAVLVQLTLNEHARNLSLAVHDANRVIEQIRQENANCTTVGGVPVPEITPPGATSWDAWLDAQGKSIPNVNQNAKELIVVTCLDRNASTPPTNPTDYCGNTAGTGVAQAGTGEWRTQAAQTSFDPIRVTVSVCWRHRRRTIGECTWGGASLSAVDGSNGPNNFVRIIESPASLTTLVTCRG